MDNPDLNQYLDYLDECYEDYEAMHLIGKKDPHECISLKCGHFDGDDCTLGRCYDPPEQLEKNETETG